MLPLNLLGVYLEHDLTQSLVGLISLLFGHAQSLRLGFVYSLTRFKLCIHLLGLQLRRDEVLRHPLLDVLVLMLCQLLEVVVLLEVSQSLVSVRHDFFSLIMFICNVDLFLARLCKLAL